MKTSPSVGGIWVALTCGPLYFIFLWPAQDAKVCHFKRFVILKKGQLDIFFLSDIIIYNMQEM